MCTRTLLSVATLAVLAGGCVTTRTRPDRSVFSFAYEGHHYEIVSPGAPGGGAANYLVLREDGQVVLRAKDVDQSGTLDAVLKGEVGLDAANRIYAAGLAEARASGRYSVRLMARRYTVSRPGGTYAVHTGAAGPDGWHNTFIVYDEAGTAAAVYRDTDADGFLDAVDKGGGPLEQGQAAYDAVLRDGVQAGRILHLGGRYVVRPR